MRLARGSEVRSSGVGRVRWDGVVKWGGQLQCAVDQVEGEV